MYSKERNVDIMTKKNSAVATANAIQKNTRQIKRASQGISAYGEMGEGLSKLNTMRGGTKGFKGFVMEELEAGEASAMGRRTEVINNNGLADLRHIKADGTEELIQMKSGYKRGQIDFNRCKGHTYKVDKGNPYLKDFQAEGKRAGAKVVQGHVKDAEAKALADAMQFETNITGSKNAVVAPTLYSGAKKLSAAHGAGISAAKSGSVAGAGFSLGSNVVQVMKGNKSVGEAAGDIVVDTAKAGAVSYGVGAAGSLMASTATGAAILETAGAVGAAVSSAPVIGSAVAAGSAATAAVGGAATAAATTAMGAAASVAGTVGGAGLVAAAAPAVIAAAPVVAVTAVVGGLFSLFFDD